VKHHKIKDSLTEEIKIIFFKMAASLPVKNNAQNLRIMSFLNNSLKENPPSTVSKIYRLPKIISIIPKNSIGRGFSPIRMYPNKSPTRHLYEFIGASIEISPICSAFIKQIEPNVHKIPAKATYNLKFNP
jgi:hypothetical protein